MRPIPRQSLCAALLAVGTLVVLFLMYLPILRVHQGWEDEIFWLSTCLSLIRHQNPIPSVLADFSGTHSPLEFYGPTLFWLGAAGLKVFGASMRSWRSFACAGNLAFLAAVAVLFQRLRCSWCATLLAVFVFSLSLGGSLGFDLPGRPDGWTLALIVLALAIAAGEHADGSQTDTAVVVRWLSFGVLIGVAASTTPRCWPLLFFLFVLLWMLVGKRWWRSLGVAAAGALVGFAIPLLPLHITPWGHVAYVRAASKNDRVNISPLLGGSWGFGHSKTQVLYYAAVLVILGLLFLSRRAKQTRFEKWLLCAGLLNVAASLLLTSRALNMFTYWAFPLEISGMLGLTRPPVGWSGRFARVLGVLLLVYMAGLRTARELPVLLHWRQRNPAAGAGVIRAAFPSGSLVYGPVGRYFYASLENNFDYRYLTEQTTPGLASIPGQIDTASPMREACQRTAYLIWPVSDAEEPLPDIPHATTQRIAGYFAAPQRTGRFERILETIPGGRSDTDERGFAVYQLQMDEQYCSELTQQRLPKPATTQR
jgi:hypothetical protein